MSTSTGETHELPGGIRLEPLRADHASSLLKFEQENRVHFAASIPDRGDDYFAHFTEMLRARLDEQAAGTCRFHVLVDSDGEVVGRVNLVDIAAGAAELGYRIAERASGRGLATAAVRRLCDIAVREYGLRSLRAATTWDNPASRAVLARVGFQAIEDIELNDRPGTRYALTLVDGDPTAAGT